MLHTQDIVLNFSQEFWTSAYDHAMEFLVAETTIQSFLLCEQEWRTLRPTVSCTLDGCQLESASHFEPLPSNLRRMASTALAMAPSIPLTHRGDSSC